jgi:hypothetical protein
MKGILIEKEEAKLSFNSQHHKKVKLCLSADDTVLCIYNPKEGLGMSVSGRTLV